MNIALICGQNSEVIKQRLPQIGDNVDTYKTVIDMVSAQKPYIYDRLVITSQVFSNKSKDDINKEASLLNRFNKENPNSILVFAMNMNESSLVNAFAKAFSSTSCTVLSMSSMTVPDVINLMQKPLVEINSLYQSIKPNVSARQRQAPAQTAQPAQPPVEKKEKHGLFGFGRGKKKADTQQNTNNQQEQKPVQAKEKRGLFGFGKKSKTEQNSQNAQVQNQQAMGQQSSGFSQNNSMTSDTNFFDEQSYQQQNNLVDLNESVQGVQNNGSSSPQEFVDLNSDKAIYKGDVNPAVNSQNVQPSDFDFNSNQNVNQGQQLQNNDLQGIDISMQQPTSSQVQSDSQVGSIASQIPANDVYLQTSRNVSDVVNNGSISPSNHLGVEQVQKSTESFVTPSDLNKSNPNVSSVPPVNVSVPFTSAPNPTEGLKTVAKSDIFNISALESEYKQKQEVTVVEKVVEKTVVVNGNDIVSNIISGASKRIILVTGDRGSGITTTALEIAKFFFNQNVRTLYIDGDLATHGVLNYLNYENLVKYGNIKMQGTKLCNSINAFDNCVIKLPEFDLLTSNYCTDICDEEFILTQSVIAEKSEDYGVVVVDIPIQYLHLCEDLMTGTPIVCVEASRRGYMNALYYLDKSNLSNRYKRVIQNKGTVLLTGVRPSLDVNKLQNYIKGVVTTDINWMSMPSLQRQGSLSKEFLNQVLSV